MCSSTINLRHLRISILISISSTFFTPRLTLFTLSIILTLIRIKTVTIKFLITRIDNDFSFLQPLIAIDIHVYCQLRSRRFLIESRELRID